MQELPKTYNPHETEGLIYDLWLKNKVFQAAIEPDKTPFTIVIPPPNVTGSLHMGHALNNTIQDILIRRARMRGIPTLWLPGTDHAGIATQNVVEKKLAKEDKRRQDLGREEFENEVWNWVDEYGHIIIDQLKKLGCSCDWSRQRFTMDPDYAQAVNSTFLHYYNKGWIYQGERVINWCVHCQTALSDIEVEHVEQPSKLYYFRYDKNFPIVIATTRPETKLGDTAVAVNPEDKRYTQYVDQEFEVNFSGVQRKIKVISDPSIDPKFGTGAVGVTPAHSLIDAELAGKHNLAFTTVIDRYGRIINTASDLDGLKVKEAREKILEWLKKEELLEKEEEITHNLSVCYRCAKEIEPQPSKQWFLKMSELARPAIEAVESGEIQFYPERWKKVYLDWMKNLRDWCISRQIWWGHRLPVWIKEKRKEKRENQDLDIYVGSNPPAGYEQSSDVLDTWFSSALWPFAALGWPEKTEDLAYFYPTTTLSTARDIIYLWVARMIFSGFEFMKDKPFQKVYIHPTVFNKEGKRMSKSLGTGVDPLELIQKYGADATRFGLAYINTGTQDIKFDENAIGAGQKFANKIWNIARFVITNLENQKSKIKNLPRGMAGQNDNEKIKIETKTAADKKILEQLESVIKSVNTDLDNFRFGQAAHALYDFVWHDLADQYLEETKRQKDQETTSDILLYVLTTSLKLLHPFMPFVTEQIWQILNENNLVKEKMLALAEWPKD